MATKNNPGQFDCYDKAEPDEPIFTLLGRDEDAPLLIQIWVELRRRRHENNAVLAEALSCMFAMQAYRKERKEKDARTS